MNQQRESETHPSRTDQTREALMAAGTELFGVQGFDGTTVEEISRRAGVNKALINYHFGGKGGLYRSILLDHFEATSRQVVAVRSEAGTAAERLRRIMLLVQERIRRRPTLPAVLLREAISGGPRLDASAVEFMATMAGAVQQIIRDGIAAGEFRDVNPFHAYQGLIGGFVFYFATTPMRARLVEAGHFPAPPLAPEEYTEHMIEMTLRGLAAGPVGGGR